MRECGKREIERKQAKQQGKTDTQEIFCVSKMLNY